jgi:hypothetical protein
MVAFIIVSCAIGEVYLSFRSAVHLYFLMFRDFSLEDKGTIARELPELQDCCHNSPKSI